MVLNHTGVISPLELPLVVDVFKVAVLAVATLCIVVIVLALTAAFVLDIRDQRRPADDHELKAPPTHSERVEP